MFDKFFEWAAFILPPLENTPLGKWRMAVAGAVCAFSFHVAWACGWVPGLQGFALADDARVQVQTVQQLQQGQNTILVRLIAGDIEAARQQQCRAIQTNNRAAADGWAVSLNSSLREYLTLAGREYVLRSCEEY